MPTFITLSNYTQEGVKLLADMDEEEYLEYTRAEVEARGGELKDAYLTMGQYDAVVITEFPDAMAGAETLLATLGKGIVEDTETMRAFDEAETRDLISRL